MNLKEISEGMFREIFSMDDAILENGYEQFLEIFDAEQNIEQATIEKIALCRANNLTVDDLIEENKAAKAIILEDMEELSPIKKKMFVHLLESAMNINNIIMQLGLHPKVNLRVEIINENATLPEYAHEDGDSGMDIRCVEDVTILPHTTIKTPTGLKFAVPLGYEIQVRPKSGISLNYHGLRVANSPGTIDANYRDEVEVIMENSTNVPMFFKKGSKIAQLVVAPVIKANLILTDDVKTSFPTERNGGFGSTGV